MPTILTECPPEVSALARELMTKNHRDLVEADVTIAYLFARNPDGEPALKHHGWPAKAIIKINSYADRMEGKKDATIKIDEIGWTEEWPAEECEALLDHELLHLEVRRDEEGHIRTDDANRPKLKMRPHDWQFGGFNTIAARHRESSLEVQAVLAVGKIWRQLKLFELEDALQPETMPSAARRKRELVGAEA